MNRNLTICLLTILLTIMPAFLAVSCASTAGRQKQESFRNRYREPRTENRIEPCMLESTDGTKIALLPLPCRKARSRPRFRPWRRGMERAGYLPMAERLARDYSVSVYLLDLRGHGCSGGARGDSPSVRQVYRDLGVIVGKAHAENPDIPLYLGGHSSGAGLVLNYVSAVRDRIPSGYFFISPYLGYKSGTDRPGSVSFTEVKVPLFVLNGISQGLLFGHSRAVFFNYQEETLRAAPLLIDSISVNMSNSMTPANPSRQFRKLDKPFGLFIGSDDELLDPGKVLAYASLPDGGVTKGSVSAAVDGENHLSIIRITDRLVGEAITRMLERR